MFLYNLKLAIRNILKQRNSYLLNISGLIIALTVCCITLFYITFEHRYVKYDFNVKKIYQIRTTDKRLGWNHERIPLGLSTYLLQNVPKIKTVIKYNETNDFQIEIAPGNVFSEWTFHFVDSNYMKYKNKKIISGSGELNNYDDLLLTREIALKYYGTTNCIGRRIIVHGHENKKFQFIVSGVFDYPALKSFRPEYNLIARLDIFNKLHHDFNPDNYRSETKAYLVFDEKADTALIKNQITEYYIKNIDKNYFNDNSVSLITPKQAYFEYTSKKVNTAIYISVIILIVALINFVIHSNAQSIERSKTLGIKKIIGGTKKSIFYQAFFESVIINTLCFLIAFLLSVQLLPHLKKYLNDAINIDYIPSVLIFTAGIIIILILSSFTSFSSLLLASQKPVLLIKKQFHKGNKGKFINSALITVQIGVFTFLMIILFLTTRQLKYLQNMDWGFKTEQLISIRLIENDKQNRYIRLIDMLHQIPGVINAAGCTHVPPSYDLSFYGYFVDGKLIEIEMNDVDNSFVETLGVKIKEGRDFNESQDKYFQGKIIVNQSFLDFKEIKDPFDPKLKPSDLEGGNRQIIGVVDDFHSRGMDVKILPMVIQLKKPGNFRNALIRISPVNASQTLKSIESAFKNVYPDLAYNMSFVDEAIQNLYQQQKNFNSLISYYSLIAVLIACMGLFGFVLYEMTKRTKEVGIRKVHGAKVREVVSVLNREFIALVLIASFLAAPLGYYYSKKWMDNFAYKTTVPFWIFLMVEVMVLAITFITISFQTLKIARRNPVEALRYE